MTAGNTRVEPFTARFPHSAAELAPLRAALRAWLGRAGIAECDRQRVLLACGEACANAVEHARPVGRATIAVTCRLEQSTGAIVVRVRDTGRWGGPAPRADRGFGLRLIGHLVDEVAVRAGARGTAVVLRILPSPACRRREAATDSARPPCGDDGGRFRALAHATAL